MSWYQYRGACQENASEFITQALEHNLDRLESRKNFVDYIANRPNVERVGAHGLFSDEGRPVLLAQVQDEVANHSGNVWSNVISLRREDAARLGYDNAAAWRTLLRRHAHTLAESMKIEPKDLRWYAAYHDQGHHPHVHLIAYSVGSKKAFVTKQGIQQMRSALAREIFRQDLLQIYERQTASRDALNIQGKDVMTQLIEEMRSGVCENKTIEADLLLLARRLRNTGGKKVYGYLKADVKAIVNRIIDELAKDARVAGCYKEWCDLRGEVLRTYKDNLPDPGPLSQQKEFKPIKNMVIAEAVSLSASLIPPGPEPAQENDFSTDSDASSDAPLLEELDMGEDGQEDGPPRRQSGYNAAWSARYKKARAFLYGNGDVQRDVDLAFRLLLQEAEGGSALAMEDLGRVQMDGLGVPADAEAAQDWYANALAAFLDVESKCHRPYIQYRIGKLYNGGLGTTQDYAEAARWFEMAAAEDHKYAQYSLAGLYLQGKGVPQDARKAFALYKKSADQDNAYADYELAKLYRDGIGTEINAELAEERFRRAFAGFQALEERSGDDKLQYRLGQMLHTGTSTTQNTAAAISYFERAAALGNADARYALAKIYLESSGPPEKVAQALEWMNQAAASGNSLAQYALGKLCLTGSHMEKDAARAVELFAKAAAQGHEHAQYTLGKLHLSGEDAPKNVDEAIRWLRAAADQGNQFAQYTLGKLYLTGRDVPRDRELAQHWLTLSAAQGNECARYLLDHMDSFRDPSAMAAATRLLRHLGNIFEDNRKALIGEVHRIDRKRLRQLREKKAAQGHAREDGMQRHQ